MLHIWILNIHAHMCIDLIILIVSCMQLKLYARNERKVREMEILEDAEYALDGSYISNWEKSTDVTQTLIVVPEVILAVLSLIAFFTAIFAVVKLSYDVFINDDKDIDLDSWMQSTFFLVLGFMICIALFGFALLVAELSLLAPRITFYVFVKQGLIYLLLASLAVALLIELFCVVFLCATKGSREDFGATFLYYVFCNIILLDIFTITWVASSMYSSILLAFAYPLHMIVLLAMIVGFVFVTSVIWAVFVSQFYEYIIQNSERSLCTWISFVLIALFILVIAPVVYYLTILGYTTTIVHHVVLTDHPLKVLLLVPSVLLFFGGWLIRRKFFGK